MPRRLILLAAALALVAAACAPDLDSFRGESETEGPRFIPNAVDIRENAGVGLGLTVDQQGAPAISYLRLNEPEAIPLAPIPADPQNLPAVMVATLGGDGIWTRTIVAQEASPPEDDTQGSGGGSGGGGQATPAPGPTASPGGDEAGPSNPKFENLGTEDTTDVAVDGQGNLHVVWTNGNRQVQYATDTGGGFASAPEDPVETIAEGAVSGVSITLADDGTPLVAFYDGDEVVAATPSGEGWTTEPIASAGGSGEGARTASASSGGTTVVAFADGDAAVVATREADGWTTEDSGDGGLGISVALDGEDPVVAGVTEGGDVVVDGDTVAEGVEPPSPSPQPTVAPSPGASPAPDPVTPTPSTGVTVDDDGNTWVAWSDAIGIAYASSDDDLAAHRMPAASSGTNPHLAMGQSGPVAAWYGLDTTSLSAALFTEEEQPFAVASPDAPIGGGGGGGGGDTPQCSAEGTELTILAPQGAVVEGFEEDCYAAPAGQAFTIEFDNQDEGQLHNVAIYVEEGGEELFRGETITGPDQITYEVDALEAGERFFRCDVHPTTMTGTFVVEGGDGEGEGEGGGGGGGEESEPTATPAGSPAAGEDEAGTETPIGG